MSCPPHKLSPHILVVLLLLFPLSQATNDEDLPKHPDSQAETLFKIMDSISSDEQWRSSYPNPCQPGSTWPGLECKESNNELHVSRLDFGNPPNPTCKKTSRFPTLIFSLPNLQSLFFFNCFASTAAKTTLALPARNDASFSSSSSLQQLSLRSNPSLTGQIPPQISHLKSLKVLTLSQNQLSGTIPEELYQLTSLLHLDLSYNKLTGNLSESLGSLKPLAGLDLSYNELTVEIPSSIGDLCRLQKIDLSSNSLSGGIPFTIGKLTELTFMALSNNRLSEKFPETIRGLASLQYLIMDENPMSDVALPRQLGDLARLQELRLAGCGFSGNIPESLSRLRNLTTLSLQNNNLVGEIPSGLGGFQHIYHLNLSGNSLSGIVPFGSSFLARLGRNLDLSGNPGLCCLRSSEAFSFKIGVTVICGRDSNKDGSLKKPLKVHSGGGGDSMVSQYKLFVCPSVLLMHFFIM